MNTYNPNATYEKHLTEHETFIVRTDVNPNIHFLEDESNNLYREFLLWKAAGNTEITLDKKISSIEKNNLVVKNNIIALEAKQHRAIREALLTGNTTKLQEIDDAILLERAKLV